MAQATITLKVRRSWWAIPFLHCAAWAAYPYLWIAGEDAAERYCEALGAFIVRHGIKTTVA